VYAPQNTHPVSHLHCNGEAGCLELLLYDRCYSVRVYTCRIADETGRLVDINIGLYGYYFNSESANVCVMCADIDMHNYAVLSKKKCVSTINVSKVYSRHKLYSVISLCLLSLS